jgi:hypothetical protein
MFWQHLLPKYGNFTNVFLKISWLWCIFLTKVLCTSPAIFFVAKWWNLSPKKIMLKPPDRVVDCKWIPKCTTQLNELDWHLDIYWYMIRKIPFCRLYKFDIVFFSYCYIVVWCGPKLGTSCLSARNLEICMNLYKGVLFCKHWNQPIVQWTNGSNN